MATESKELQRAKAAQVPAFIKQNDTRGTENITDSDIKLPALKIAQSTSDETKRNKPEFIDGLREGEFFNNVSREIYGEDPLKVTVIHYLGRRNMVFDPNNRKVVVEANIPDDDPRCQFTEEVDAASGQRKRVPPVAVTFKDFLVVVSVPGAKPEVMTLSFKKTQLGKSKIITSALDRFARKGLPAFAQKFKIGIVSETKPKGTFYGWTITPDGWADEVEYNLAAAQYDRLKNANIKPTDDADDDEGGEGDEKVPF